MDLLPKVMVLGHSFVRRLASDLDRGFDERTTKDFGLNQCYIRMFGVGGRTVEKLRKYDLKSVTSLRPDIVLLEIGTNDLSTRSPVVVGSEIDDLVNDLLDRFGVKLVGVFTIIPRADPVFNKKVKIVNQYLKVVLGDRHNVFVWGHRKLLEPQNEVLLPDGVHLNCYGQYRLYRSYRGAIIHAVHILEKMD